MAQNKGSLALTPLVAEHGKKAELARELAGGVDTAMVGRWASGERKPATRNRVQLQERFGIDWTWWDIEVKASDGEAA